MLAGFRRADEQAIEEMRRRDGLACLRRHGAAAEEKSFTATIERDRGGSRGQIQMPDQLCVKALKRRGGRVAQIDSGTDAVECVEFIHRLLRPTGVVIAQAEVLNLE